MAEIWGIVTASVVSAGVGAYSANRAAGAQQSASNSANAEQARQYDQTREDFRPQRELGQGATEMLGRLYGIPVQSQAQAAASADRLVGNTYLPGDTQLVSTDGGKNRYYDVMLDGQRIGALRPGGASGQFVNDTGIDIHQLIRNRQPTGAAAPGATTGPDMSVFFESPDYRFNLTEGQKAIDRSLAARGRALSGAGVREGMRYASGQASTEYGNFYNRLANLAGLGQSATQSTAAFGANAANNISQNNLIAGQARANGYLQTGQAVNNAVQGGYSNYLLSQYLNKPAGGG